MVAAHVGNPDRHTVYIGDSTVEEIDRLGARLRGAIVLTHRPQVGVPSRGPDAAVCRRRTGANGQPSASGSLERHADTADARAPSGARRRSRSQAGSDGAWDRARAGQPRDTRRRGAFGGARGGAVQHAGPSGAGRRADPARASRFVARFHQDPTRYNVLAEIPGTDPALRDEVVLVGAHLDSWHTATGATDNADGVAAAMEAMRILAASRPDPAGRSAWPSGEARSRDSSAPAPTSTSISRDEAARARISVYLNDDPGTGATYGFYMEENAAAKAIFDALARAAARSRREAERHRGIGSTDHVPFDEAGVPAFTAIKDFRNYDVRTRHTNADLADAVNVDDLKQSAVVLAVVAWHAAMRDESNPAPEAMMKRTITRCGFVVVDDQRRCRDTPLRADASSTTPSLSPIRRRSDQAR